MFQRRQILVLSILLVVYAFIAYASYAFFFSQLTAVAGAPVDTKGIPPVTLGLANAGIILVFYGLLALAGYWFARKLNLPGIFSEEGNWRRWVFIPMLIGALGGVALVVLDVVFAPINGFGHFPHPPFPFSILASLAAGIGEEILFRGFVFGLWAIILNWLLKRVGGRKAALWIANILAAIAFSAGHLGSFMVLTGASSPAALNPVLLAEGLLLNGAIGLLAGERYIKDGLVAAAGVHFWADFIWHVCWGLFF